MSNRAKLEKKIWQYCHNYYGRNRKWPDLDTVARGISRGRGVIADACEDSRVVRIVQGEGARRMIELPFEPPSFEPGPPLIVRRTVTLNEEQDAFAQRLAGEGEQGGVSGVIRNALDEYMRRHQ